MGIRVVERNIFLTSCLVGSTINTRYNGRGGLVANASAS